MGKSWYQSYALGYVLAGVWAAVVLVYTVAFGYTTYRGDIDEKERAAAVISLPELVKNAKANMARNPRLSPDGEIVIEEKPQGQFDFRPLTKLEDYNRFENARAVYLFHKVKPSEPLTAAEKKALAGYKSSDYFLLEWGFCMILVASIAFTAVAVGLFKKQRWAWTPLIAVCVGAAFAVAWLFAVIVAAVLIYYLSKNWESQFGRIEVE